MKQQKKSNPLKKLERGFRGRFVSRKNKIELKTKADPITLTFYGKTIRKFLVSAKPYFVITDILALASPSDISLETISYTDDYDEVKNEVTKTVNQLEVADAAGILKLIKEVVGIFPGPLARWLTT